LIVETKYCFAKIRILCAVKVKKQVMLAVRPTSPCRRNYYSTRVRRNKSL